MKKTPLEPGLLQVFRIYAWLRLASLAFVILVGSSERIEPLVNLRLVVFWLALSTAILLAYLYWPKLGLRLGVYYFPLGLAFATLSLLFEQQLFMARAFLQMSPFLYILLILVSWQYDFREVVFFSLVTAMIEGILRSFLPPMVLFISEGAGPGIEMDQVIYAGVLASRTISFLVLGYVVTRLMQAQRAQRQALADANQKLVSHAATLEQLTVSRERLRLSRELHDTLAHTLSALTVQIEAVLTVWDTFPDKARQLTEQMAIATRSGLDETRRVLRALRAAPLEEMGLVAALRTLVQDFAARHSLALELTLPDEETLDDLPPEVEQCYYRVAQEALENTARHAGAQKLRVFLRQEAGCLLLHISDDGRGFEPGAADERQLGLRGMQERAELIGAHFSVDSRLGRGAQIELSLERPGIEGGL